MQCTCLTKKLLISITGTYLTIEHLQLLSDFSLIRNIVFQDITHLGICRGTTSVLCLKQVLQTHRLCIGAQY